MIKPAILGSIIGTNVVSLAHYGTTLPTVLTLILTIVLTAIMFLEIED